MKKINIDGDTVTYYYKDESGTTLATALNDDDKRCIARDIDKGKDKGKLVVKSDVTLYWSVEF